MCSVCQEEVVEVSSNLLRRMHGRIEIKLFQEVVSTEVARKHTCLNTGSDIELCSDPLLLGRDLGDVLDVVIYRKLHGKQAFREHLYLVFCFDRG